MVSERARQQVEGVAGLAQPAFGEPAFVHGVPANETGAQGAGGPLAEAHAPLRVDPVADGDDGVQVVVLRAAPDPAVALGTNC